MRRVGLVLLVWACGGKTTPTKPVEKPPPTCAAAADHMLTLIEPKDDHARKIRDIFQTRCEQDEWSASPRNCIVSTTSLKDPKGCKGALTLDQREGLDRDLAEAERVARARKLPPACEDYKRLIEELQACNKLPQQSRDALKQGFDAMAQGWKDIETMPDDARRAMEDGCKAGADALRQVSASVQCGTP